MIDALPGVTVIADSPERVPVPDSATDWGLLDALSVMTRDPVRVPRAVGVKVIEKEQVPPLARVRGANGQLLVWAKSPEMEIDEIVRGTV